MSRSPEALPTAVLGRRYVAHVVDVLVYAAAALVPFLLLGTRSTVAPADGDPVVDAFRLPPDYAIRLDDQQFLFERNDVVLVAVVPLVVVLLFAVLVQGRWGWTPGKALTGIRTVDGDGGRPGVGRALLRTLLLVLDAVPSLLVPLVGGLTIAMTRTNRRLGDLAAGTYVVHRGAVDTFPDGTRVLEPGDEAGDAAPLPVTTLEAGEALRVGEAADPAERDQRAEAAARAERRPRWDPARKAYLQWDPRREVWLQYDDTAGEWHPIT